MSYLTVLTAISLACVCHAATFHFNDCMSNGRSNPENIVHVNSATVTPFPVVVPGPVNIVGNLDILKNISGPVQMHLTVKRKVLGLWITVPCISNVGSCTYDDVCSMMSTSFMTDGAPHCPQQLAGEGVPCTCPFSKGHYSLEHAQFQIPELSGVWSWLASGDYQVKAVLTDKARNTQTGCHSMEMSIGAPCTFFSCLFG